jgi:hypothetical protein
MLQWFKPKPKGPARLVVKVSGFLHGGKVKVTWPANFRRMEPRNRLSYIDQTLAEFREERRIAAEHQRIVLRDEDARNAEAAVLRGQPETA